MATANERGTTGTPQRANWRVQFKLRTLLLLFVLAAATWWWFRPVGLDARHFPLAVGNCWEYTADSGAEMTVEVVAEETWDGKQVFILERERNGRRDRCDRMVVGIRPNGVFIYEYGGIRFFPPWNMVPFHSTKDDWYATYADTSSTCVSEDLGRWQLDIINLGQTPVRVPAGNFRCWQIERDGVHPWIEGFGEMNADYWLARDVGIVEMKGWFPLVYENNRAELRHWKLTRFERGDGK